MCSTVDSPVCFQGNNITIDNQFNEANEWSSSAITECETCLSQGYSYFYGADFTFPEVEEWMLDNPLCALANSTNIPELVSVGTLQGWDCDGMTASSNYCDGWTGVSCFNTSAPFPFNNSIGALSLPSVSLVGSLPTQIGNMPFLTLLDLSGNSLSHTIPSQIGGLINVLNVSLDSNDFSSSIPAGLFGMTRMVDLDVSNNKLTGSIPEQVNLAQFLASINFANNKLIGTVSILVLC
jgi:hypothetical protein